jgi:PAT family beta-lactamase induction signal transducer AmpG
VSTTYFAEGYPYSIVHQIAEAMFKEFGASLQAIGLTALFHLPWNLKFLWGPWVDRYGTKRAWLVGIEVVLSALLVVLALTTSLPHVLAVASVVFIALAFLSATHDIAIDGYYLEALDTAGQSRWVGFRAMAYRIAMFVVASPAFILIDRAGWLLTLMILAALMGLLTTYHLLLLPRAETQQLGFGDLLRSAASLKTLLIGAAVAATVAGGRWLVLSSAAQEWIAARPALAAISTAGWIGLALLLALMVLAALAPMLGRRIAASRSHYAHAFLDFLDQPRIGVILGFVVLLRTGESFLLKMRYAFLREIGVTPEQFGWANGLAIWATIVATMLGGWLISRHGLKRWIWPFVLAQNLLNLLYMTVAHRYEPFIGTEGAADALSLPFVTSVIVVEGFGSGLGTAVFMVYLMRCCKRAHKAAHYAILSALMSVSFTVAGVLSGFLAGALGFEHFFGFTFLATIPGMTLILFLPYLDGTSAAGSEPRQRPE